MDSFRTAYVYVRNTFAGELRETAAGYRFTYDPAYLASDRPGIVSLTLPHQSEDYSSKTQPSFFDNLIPEGWLLESVLSNWKIDRNDRFGLLHDACKNCNGNVTNRVESL